MSIRLLRVLVLVLLASIVALAREVSPAFADDERWVRHYRGGEISALDRAWDLVVHPSGEITVVGLSCKDLVVLRLDNNGKQLWLQEQRKDNQFPWDLIATSSGEDVIVSANYYYPYYENLGEVYRYDRSGNTVWERGGISPISAMIEDGTGGTIQVGEFINDLGSNPGFVRRMAADGQIMWSDFVEPSDVPGEYISGNMKVVAKQDSSWVYAAGAIKVAGDYGQILAKYDLDGQLEWNQYVRPDDRFAIVTWIGPARDETVAVAGVDSVAAWLERRGPDGGQLWIRSLPELPIFATNTEGDVYTALAIPGQSDGTDVQLTALGPNGDELWQSIYDSGPGTIDSTATMTVAGDGTIVVLVTNENHLLLLRYDPLGHMLSTETLGLAPPSGTSLVMDLAGGRTFAFGSIAQGTCCDASSNLYVAAYDQGGTGPQVWVELDRPMVPNSSMGVGVGVGSDGSVTTSVRTSYSCANALDLVHYESDGTLGWTRVHPESDRACFHPSGEITVGCKRGASIQLARYEEKGGLIWSRSFQSSSDSYADGLADGLAATSDNGLVVMDVMTSGTLVIAVDAVGAELWRRWLEGIRAGPLTVGPDGHTYLQSWIDSQPRIHCLTSEGEVAWTRVLSGPERLSPDDITAGDGGVFYLAGHVFRAGRIDWATWRLGPDGATQWIAYELGGAGDMYLNVPIRVRVHPEGGVVVAGTTTGTTRDAVVVRYDEQGGVQWRSGLDTPADERCTDMAIDAAGNVIVTMGVDIGNIRTVKYDPSGAVVWSRDYSLGSGGTSYPIAMGVGPDLSAAVVGVAGGDSAFTIKYEDPTPVEISRFAAARNGEDVLVSWEIGAGLAPLGFNVLNGSAPDRIKEQVNPERLPADARSFVHRAAPTGDAYYVLEVIELDGGSIRHGPVLATAAGAPSVFWATGPHPNPAWEAVEWKVGLPGAGRLRIAVHDALGRTVAEVVDKAVPAGEHRVPWDGRLASGARAPAGIYFYRLTAGAETRTGKFVLSPPR